MPSADMRSNRCVPLRGTSAGYASASSASIRLLKSGAAFAAGPVVRWLANKSSSAAILSK